MEEPRELPADVTVPQSQLLPMQLIASALMMGLLICLGVFLYMVFALGHGQGAAGPGTLPVVSLVAVAMLAVNVPLSIFIPRTQTRAALQQIAAQIQQSRSPTEAAVSSTGPSKLLELRQSTLIVGAALLEAAGFMGCIAFFLEGQVWVVGVVAAVLLLMAVNFPTEQRVRAWLEQQTALLAEMRQDRSGAAER